MTTIIDLTWTDAGTEKKPSVTLPRTTPGFWLANRDFIIGFGYHHHHEVGH